ncbi:hypothetical protein CA13_23950 [Planctomycetes bacterium CA13]|uniref:Uncharacterized protein n=1 Tax=Novipirellula herctigrandis TaxID=2527986 RepID=A0A5C5Z0P5_9BACT|nr:hypothetical protein CA13_23950 [Planctomycetes bacterium CA13]
MDATNKKNTDKTRLFSTFAPIASSCVLAIAASAFSGNLTHAESSEFARMLQAENQHIAGQVSNAAELVDPVPYAIDAPRIARNRQDRVIVVPKTNDVLRINDANQLGSSTVKAASRFHDTAFIFTMQDNADEEDLKLDANEEDADDVDADEITRNRKKRNLLDQDESQGRQPEVLNGRFELPALAAATTNTSNVGNGKTPDGFRADHVSPVAPLPESGIERDDQWTWTMRTWAAPNTFSNPRYFEDRMLERHGHERWGHWTPLASGVRFFGTAPLLPYLATVQHPTECEYTLGYFRTGNCAPAYLQRPPYERKAVVAEATAIAAGVLIIP